MRCDSCGRGWTYRRIERDAAFSVQRRGGGHHRYCGACVDRGKVELREFDQVMIFLGDGPGNFRARYLQVAEAP